MDENDEKLLCMWQDQDHKTTPRLCLRFDQTWNIPGGGHRGWSSGSTWRKAMPTAMPATVRRLCSSHSSPACKQPFSFTILSKPTLQRNKTCKRNRKKNLQLIKQREVLWYLNVQSVLQRCPDNNLQKNKKTKQGGAHAKHGCLISNDTSSPGPQRKNGKIAKATKQQTDRESQEDQRAWAPTWRTLMATATPATGTRFLSTHSSPARRHPLSYITRV